MSRVGLIEGGYMRGLAMTALMVAVLSLIVGIVSRFMMQRLPIAPNGLGAQDFLDFANTCFLAAIAFGLLKK